MNNAQRDHYRKPDLPKVERPAMTQTYKERVEQAFRDEVPLSPRELRDLAAEADAQLASKDAEIAQVYAAAGEAQAERDAARDERDAFAAEVARLVVEVRRLGGLLKGCEALSDVLRPHADRYLWIRADGLDFIRWECLTDETCDVGLDAAIDAKRKKG